MCACPQPLAVSNAEGFCCAPRAARSCSDVILSGQIPQPFTDAQTLRLARGCALGRPESPGYGRKCEGEGDAHGGRPGFGVAGWCITRFACRGNRCSVSAQFSATGTAGRLRPEGEQLKVLLPKSTAPAMYGFLRVFIDKRFALHVVHPGTPGYRYALGKRASTW